MSTQRYSIISYPIEAVLAWVKSGEIAIPEIQRLFVWDAIKVRNLFDSLYRGYPIGYLIVWRGPTIKLKDRPLFTGKRILIDGRQRVTALMTSLLGYEVLTKEYEVTRIRIAFHPQEKRFEVSNSTIAGDASWLPDIAEVFTPDASLFQLVNSYCAKNPDVSQDEMFVRIENLRKIINNHVGVIELTEGLGIEAVTEIFVRVNSAGVVRRGLLFGHERDERSLDLKK